MDDLQRYMQNIIEESEKLIVLAGNEDWEAFKKVSNKRAKAIVVFKEYVAKLNSEQANRANEGVYLRLAESLRGLDCIINEIVVKEKEKYIHALKGFRNQQKAQQFYKQQK